MSLCEALVVVGIVGLSVMAMGTVTVGVVRAREGVEQDVVGGYVLDGFLEEAVRERPGAVTPAVPAMRLTRLKWVQLWVPEAARTGARAGPLVERRPGPGTVEVSVRFGGAMPRVMRGSVRRSGSSS